MKISEDSKHGATVAYVYANDDDDSHDNKKIDYTILSGNTEQVFEISTSEGMILLTGTLDREQLAEYELVVMATDRGEPPLSTSATVKITVKDVNDNAPQFADQQDYTVEVDENLGVGATVIVVTATDVDSGVNGKVEYKIASGNDGNHFEIERDEGVISVRTTLDYETVQQHKLIIQATDSSSVVQRSAFTVVRVDVRDVNEFRPTFPQAFYFHTTMEKERVGTHVFTAQAVDGDAGVYGKVHYSLLDSGGLFNIDTNSGDVTTAATFTYYTLPSQQALNRHTFRVRAIDMGGLDRNVSVIVDIEPKFIPSFPKDEYDFSVPGNARKGDIVGQVVAGSEDSSGLGIVVYQLKEHNEYFSINSTSGVIFVMKDLQVPDDEEDEDNELRRRKRALRSDSVTLTVLAVSGVSNPQTDTTSIEIEIDRTCAGCEAPPVSKPSSDNSDGIGTPIVLAVVLTIIAVILAVVIIIMYFKRKDRKRHLSEAQYDSSFENLEVPPPVAVHNVHLPSYSEARRYPHHVTTSEISDQSQSMSSGHGSVEEEDEEVRMFNAIPSDSGGVINIRVPDSGIQQDEDALSDHSIQNHQQYLARLGIDSGKIQTHNHHAKSHLSNGTSVESMHQFSDEGGGMEEADIGNLVYTKMDTLEAAKMGIMDGTHEYGHGGAEPIHQGSLSSVINSEEEFSGSYNWDYLLDWGPQYQPLAHVFAEIARLKDDSIKQRQNPLR